jgi:hypothetical protein
VFVAVQEAQHDLVRRRREALEDRALVHAIPTPRAGQAQHVHPPDEPTQHRGLLGPKQYTLIHGLPPLAVLRRTVPRQELVITQARLELASPVHPRAPRIESYARTAP